MLPPTIPTSFIPHPTPAPGRQFRTDIAGAFGFFAYAVLGVVFALALGVFFYGRILAASRFAKDAALAAAEAAINPTTIENFVRLRDRLVSGEKLIANHIAFSGFFASLSVVLPSTVRFISLHLSVDDAGKTKFDGIGVAKNFNALAAASTAFAANGRIKDAIFSNIVVNGADNSVSFGLTAMLDPRIIAFSPSTAAAAPRAPNPSAATTTGSARTTP